MTHARLTQNVCGGNRRSVTKERKHYALRHLALNMVTFALLYAPYMTIMAAFALPELRPLMLGYFAVAERRSFGTWLTLVVQLCATARILIDAALAFATDTEVYCVGRGCFWAYSNPNKY